MSESLSVCACAYVCERDRQKERERDWMSSSILFKSSSLLDTKDKEDYSMNYSARNCERESFMYVGNKPSWGTQLNWSLSLWFCVITISKENIAFNSFLWKIIVNFTNRWNYLTEGWIDWYMTPILHIKWNVTNSKIQKYQNSIQFSFNKTKIWRTGSSKNKAQLHF